MNLIYLKGILKNIQYSHSIGDVAFNKAEMIVKRDDGREDLIIVKFKQFSFEAVEDKEVELVGNIRSFSKQVDGKNKVNIYVFSYFDLVEEDFGSNSNLGKLAGKICKKDNIRTTRSGKHYIHFILANNIIVGNTQKINSYIPCVAWGKTAQTISSDFNVGDVIKLEGQLHSRDYTKKQDAGEVEIKIAHEFAISSIVE